jgi:hypothetical protein
MVNFNNPQNLNLSNSFSTVSATLENPAVAQTPEYGDFRSADPGLAALLPKNLNYGITSPGTVNMETQCNGLDFMDTNPDFSRLPFSACLEKFNDQYRIPEMAFNNLMNSLPYTFSALTHDEQRRYLTSLQNFVDTETNDSNRPIKPRRVSVERSLPLSTKKEKFGSETSETSETSNSEDCLGNKTLSSVLFISIIVILVALFFLCLLKMKNKI